MPLLDVNYVSMAIVIKNHESKAMVKTSIRIALFSSFILVIVAANWSIKQWGVVPIGFGLMAPAGVYFAGLAFSIRDGLHESANARWIIVAIVLGAGVSYQLEDVDKIAIASGVAFLCSELADFLVYTPLRNKGKMGALLLSNAVGLVLDSIIFLYLAFGSLEFLSGQITAKAYMTGAVLVLMLCYKLIKRQRSTTY